MCVAALTSLPAWGRSLAELPWAAGGQWLIPPSVLQVHSSSYDPSLPLCSEWRSCLWGPASMARGWLRTGKDRAEPWAQVTFPPAVSFAVPCQPGSIYSPAQQGREILPRGLGSACRVTGRETQSWCGVVPRLLHAPSPWAMVVQREAEVRRGPLLCSCYASAHPTEAQLCLARHIWTSSVPGTSSKWGARLLRLVCKSAAGREALPISFPSQPGCQLWGNRVGSSKEGHRSKHLRRQPERGLWSALPAC